MSRSATLVVLSMTLAACSEDKSGWSRVVSLPDGGGYYSIVQVDPLTDTCIKVGLREPSAGFVQDQQFEVEIQGLDWIIQSANGDDMAGAACTTGNFQTNPTAASGTIEFGDFINTKQTGAPCSVSFDLVIEAVNGKTYTIAQRELPIRDTGCPRPALYSAEYTDLHAAYGEYNGLGNLVISSWDPDREVCVWARFSTGAGPNSQRQVTIDGTWVYAGLRFGRTEREACVASGFIVPPIDTDYLSDSAPALDSGGRVTFVSSEPQALTGGQPLEVPCTIDVDLSLQSQGRYYWTPDDVFMRATGVAVAGACD